ncbi:hypothetical protein KJ766_03485 [Patescibacteria group bacterium]|nr:hypothetical protein [Patescibacteria group bacterium]
MFDAQLFFEEVKNRAIIEGVNSKEGFDSLVELMLVEKTGAGDIDDDAPTENIESTVKARWQELASELSGE